MSLYREVTYRFKPSEPRERAYGYGHEKPRRLVANNREKNRPKSGFIKKSTHLKQQRSKKLAEDPSLNDFYPVRESASY